MGRKEWLRFTDAFRVREVWCMLRCSESANYSSKETQVKCKRGDSDVGIVKRKSHSFDV